MKIPDAPFFVSPIKEAGGGVDFLGLRQANLNLMSEFLPGINNVTLRIRPYALMSWTFWAFREQLKLDNRTELSSDEYRKFREKIEVLFNWSHQLHHAGTGLVGNAQISKSSGEIKALTFENWTRNVSWMDAVFYGPSLKNENGLGFLHLSDMAKVFQVTTLGEEMAKAFDECLRGDGAYYDELRSLSENTASQSMATELFKLWNVNTPSDQEKQIFLGALYDPNSIGQENLLGLRSSSIRLILEALKAAGEPVSLEKLRADLTYDNFIEKTGDSLENVLTERQLLWRVLQIRQAQRLAFETLMGWLERKIFEGELRHTEGAVTEIIRELNESGTNLDTWLEDKICEIERSANEEGLSWILNDGVDTFSQSADLINKLRVGPDFAVSPAIQLLLHCAVLANQLSSNPKANRLLSEGATTRVSLKHWASLVYRSRRDSVKRFLRLLVETYLVSQHLGVAAARYTGEAQKLRLSIEEEGLVSLLDSLKDCWSPNLTPDRLEAMLSLMSDCGLIQKTVVDGTSMYSKNITN